MDALIVKKSLKGRIHRRDVSPEIVTLSNNGTLWSTIVHVADENDLVYDEVASVAKELWAEELIYESMRIFFQNLLSGISPTTDRGIRNILMAGLVRVDII